MGAHSIATIGYGRNAKEAYNRAVEDALYEDGHDAYNGTISTTNGFRLDTIKGQKRITKKAIDKWVEQAEDRTEKWGQCLALELPRSHDASKRARKAIRGGKAYIFVGWAAC